MGEGKPKRRRRSRSRRGRWSLFHRILAVLLAVPALYLLAALIGSLVPVNSDWVEPDEGVTVYLFNNGIHADIVMPVRAHGVDWVPVFPRSQFASVPEDASWIAFGSGEEQVYLNTPTWWELTPATVWSALTGGKRVMHVQYVRAPATTVRAIRLRPEEYRRLWAAVRADFKLDRDGSPSRIAHPGYGPSDAFYWSSAGRFSALSTCNTWAADKLRIAGVKTSLWPPFVEGLVWRYREESQLQLFGGRGS